MPVNASNPVMRYVTNRRFTYSMDWDLRNVNRGRINNYGFVNEQDYDTTHRTPLLAVVGDSYVEALMVPYGETLHGLLGSAVGSRGRVYSFGLSGASLAQYLVEADFARTNFRPDGLVIVIVGNDFDESLLRYRPTPGFHYFVGDSAEPRLVRLDFTPTLLRRTLGKFALARYMLYNVGVSGLAARVRATFRGTGSQPVQVVGNTPAATDSQRMADSRSVVNQFLEELPEKSGLDPSHILLVLDGMRPNLYTEEDLRRARGTYFDLMRNYLRDSATRRGIEVVDMQPRFIERHRRDGAVFEFPADGHWNAIGHGEAAAAVRGSTVFRRVFGSVPASPDIGGRAPR